MLNSAEHQLKLLISTESAKITLNVKKASLNEQDEFHAQLS